MKVDFTGYSRAQGTGQGLTFRSAFPTFGDDFAAPFAGLVFDSGTWFPAAFPSLISPKAQDLHGTVLMSRDYYTMEELTHQLGRDLRVVEKQVSRGNIPGRRVGGEWRFNKVEITNWLELEIRGFSETDLAVLERSQKSDEVCELSPVSSLLHPDLVEVPLDAGTKPSVLKKLVEVSSRTWQVFDTSAIFEAVKNREEVASTGFEGGVAVPHPQNRMLDVLGESVIAFGRTESGIPFGGPGRQLTDLFFLVLARDSTTHLKVIARLGRLFQTPNFLTDLRAAEDSSAAYDVIIQADQSLKA